MRGGRACATVSWRVTDIIINEDGSLFLRQFVRDGAAAAGGNPVSGTWRWWGDLWAWLDAAFADGKLSIRVACWDDIHRAVADDPLKGDCVVLRLGDWRILLTGTKEKTEVRFLAKPDGAQELPPGALKLSYVEGYHHKYVLAFDPKVLGFEDEIPLNVRVYDNDGKGFDGWIEYSPLDGDCPAVIRLR